MSIHRARRWFVNVCVMVAWATLVDPAAVRGQDDPDESPYRPGLVAGYTAGASSATRIDEVVAFDWQDAACDPRLPAGRFEAVWRGRLWARGSGEYRLAAYVQGKVSIAVAGRTLIEGEAAEPQWLLADPVTLEFDHHSLEIRYERTGAAGRLALFWTGPDFSLEPVPAWALVHDRDLSPAAEFERGRRLAAALKCGACHAGDAAGVTPAPALDRLTGNIQEGWLVEWLSGQADAAGGSGLRRMPHLGLDENQATAIAAWLLREPAETPNPPNKKEPKAAKQVEKGKKSKSKKGEEKPRPSAEAGERLLLTRGCLACHQLGSLGESGLFGGGGLAAMVTKRPPGFAARWLSDPAAINRSHRMPVFSLTSDELESIRLREQRQWEQSSPRAPVRHSEAERRSLVRQGEQLVGALRCANCHLTTRDAKELAKPAERALTAQSDWSRSCLSEPNVERKQPGYRLAEADRAALKAYYTASRPGEGQLSPQARGRDLLVQLNCLACHQREGIARAANALPATLQEKLTAVAATHEDLAPLVPAMTPPALNSVGDKLHDAALIESISRQGPPHRPYLLAQMPKFRLDEEQLKSLATYFTATDRIPDGYREGEAPAEPRATNTAALFAAGPRLVTTDGLACTSCHDVGSVPPAKAPINARGPNLSMLQRRIRKPWFDRWCADPARIVPRMEMPSVKIPVRGVLNDNVKDQLESVWLTLNTPSFEPPEPNPVRTLRLSGVPDRNERPIVIHDVVKDGDKTYLYPLIIGLPNRHNILFDLETNRLAAWWLGDTARQRTKGKSWFWEMGGKSLLAPPPTSELVLLVDGVQQLPVAVDQFTARLDSATSWLGDIDFMAHVVFGPSTKQQPPVLVAQKFEVPVIDSSGGFARRVVVMNAPQGSKVRLRIVDASEAAKGVWDAPRRTFRNPGSYSIHIERPENLEWNGDGTITFSGVPRGVDDFAPTAHWLNATYKSDLPADQYLTEPIAPVRSEAAGVQIAPGFSAQRLPLPIDLMPSAIAFQPNGQLAFGTLKGEVWVGRDGDGDGLEDQLKLVADGLATPYGLTADAKHANQLLVGAKTGLLRIGVDAETSSDPIASMSIVASGWGHTDDYHDWAVGPVRGDNGEYFIALPCQQDQRSDVAAHYRGRLIKLIPQDRQSAPVSMSVADSREYDIEVISAGHRFPMGIGRNREGELFVTDNQGNYNPFNELNHVRKGAHFGFINALEKQSGYQPPPLSEPAINIPHPWTRSVNGICFLDTPEALSAGAKPGPGEVRNDVERSSPGAGLLPAKSIYGPLEGHLIGCEYDTRRLIRMSLQKIGDTYQGAAYPLSIPTEDVEKGLLGPIVCAIKPITGELYVGEIRDSGWGASNNIGQIVKIKIEPEKFPCGIAEVRATSTGFTIDFFKPVDRAKAADPASYTIESYRRESTPAYGGPDLDRRAERISAVELSADGKRATLKLPELRPRHVYEIKLKNLAPDNAMFHPDEAHYTLRRIPQ